MNTMLCFFTCKYFLKPIFDDIGGERGGTGMEAGGADRGKVGGREHEGQSVDQSCPGLAWKTCIYQHRIG